MNPEATRAATAGRGGEKGRFPEALFSTTQIGSFDRSESRVSFSTKVRDCVVRALDATGSSPAMQQLIFWNLSVTKKVEPNEVGDKPREFMEGIRAIFGDAGSEVFEFMLIREITREFSLKTNAGSEKKSLAEVLQFIGLEI